MKLISIHRWINLEEIICEHTKSIFNLSANRLRQRHFGYTLYQIYSNALHNLLSPCHSYHPNIRSWLILDFFHVLYYCCYSTDAFKFKCIYTRQRLQCLILKISRDQNMVGWGLGKSYSSNCVVILYFFPTL